MGKHRTMVVLVGILSLGLAYGTSDAGGVKYGDLSEAQRSVVGSTSPNIANAGDADKLCKGGFVFFDPKSTAVAAPPGNPAGVDPTLCFFLAADLLQKVDASKALYVSKDRIYFVDFMGKKVPATINNLVNVIGDYHFDSIRGPEIVPKLKIVSK